jgi:hypothetical protein
LVCLAVETEKISLTQAQIQDISDFLKIETERFASLMSLLDFWEMPKQENQTMRNLKIVKSAIGIELGLGKTTPTNKEELQTLLCA